MRYSESLTTDLTKIFLAGIRQFCQIEAIILIGRKNYPPVVTPMEHVLRMSGYDNARKASHIFQPILDRCYFEKV